MPIPDRNILQNLNIKTQEDYYGHLALRGRTSLKILHESLRDAKIQELDLGFLIGLMETVQHGLERYHELEDAWANRKELGPITKREKGNENRKS